MRVAALLVALALAAPALAETPDQKLARLTRGRIAGAPVECIRPEFSTHFEIVDGQAIILYAPGKVYVSRPAGGCVGLSEDARITTSPISGQLCRGEQFRLVSPAGSSGFSVCAFGPFVPYAKAR